MTTDDSLRADPDDRPDRFRATDLLPIVRAALARGEGPPAVLAWVRTNGYAVGRCPRWTPTDEARARVLADRLAVTLNDCRRGHRGTEPVGGTVVA
jgi:hypothetical protein